MDGPFANTTLHFGPVFPLGNRNRTGLEYSPHCMTRDFLQTLSKQFLSRESVDNLLSQPTLADFRSTLDAGIHFAGHSGVGGYMSDIFTSPQDPVFYFHHCQIDRLWTVWQEQSLATRLNAVSDTTTYSNSKCSACALTEIVTKSRERPSITPCVSRRYSRVRLCWRWNQDVRLGKYYRGSFVLPLRIAYRR